MKDVKNIKKRSFVRIFPIFSSLMGLCLIALVLSIVIPICNSEYDCFKEDELFYKNGEILNIRMDDDGEYHLLVKYKDNEIVSFHDIYNARVKYIAGCTPIVSVPFVRWEDCSSRGVIKATTCNSTDYSLQEILIYLPSTKEIEFFDD